MAEQYFNNADHDLTDALILFFAERQDQILSNYGLIRSTEMYPRFVEWAAKIGEAQTVIRASRGNRHNRLEEYHKLATNHIPELSSQYKDLRFSEKLYATKLKKETFFAKFTLWFGFVGTIFGFVVTAAGVLTLWVDWPTVLLKLHSLMPSLF